MRGEVEIREGGSSPALMVGLVLMAFGVIPILGIGTFLCGLLIVVVEVVGGIGRDSP